MTKAPKNIVDETAADAVREVIAKLAGRPVRTAEAKTSRPDGNKRQKPGKKTA